MSIADSTTFLQVRARSSGSRRRFGPLWLAVGIALLVSVPMLALWVTAFGGQGVAPWRTLLESGLATYALNSVVLTVTVTLGALLLGAISAWLTAEYRFVGSKWLSWALVLPLAIPAYVIAYAYTDLLQVSGPVQTWIRDTWSLRPRSYWFPEIRSIEGAAFIMTLVLYPYVYLPARAAFAQVSPALVESARLAGANSRAVLWRVQLPLLWPALAGGATLVAMETLADYGATSYFAIDTFTVGIYKAWLNYGDRVAAARLALMLLVVVAILVVIERRSRAKRAFVSRSTQEARAPKLLTGWRALAAFIFCFLPVLVGFLVPLFALLSLHLREDETLALARVLQYAFSSVRVAVVAAIVIVAVALLLAYAQRVAPSRWLVAFKQFACLGYAVPGAVLALGVLIPLARFDNALDAFFEARFNIDTGLLLTGSVTALVYAYAVRFLALGVQNIDAGFAKITHNMDAAARSLGASPWALMRRVHVPMLSRSLAIAALLVFVDVLKELPATLALRPFNFDTLATQAYNFAKDERLAQAALPSLVIVAIALIPVLLTAREISRRRG